MTGNVAKSRTIEGKSAVEVRRKTAKILDLQRISVSWGLSGSRIGHVADQTPSNRGPDSGIIDCVVCRSTNYDVKWQILNYSLLEPL